MYLSLGSYKNNVSQKMLAQSNKYTHCLYRWVPAAFGRERRDTLTPVLMTFDSFHVYWGRKFDNQIRKLLFVDHCEK